VRLLTTVYHSGVRLSKKAIVEVETHVERLIGLERWFVDISCATPDTSFFLNPLHWMSCIPRNMEQIEVHHNRAESDFVV